MKILKIAFGLVAYLFFIHSFLVLEIIVSSFIILPVTHTLSFIFAAIAFLCAGIHASSEILKRRGAKPLKDIIKINPFLLLLLLYIVSATSVAIEARILGKPISLFVNSKEILGN